MAYAPRVKTDRAYEIGRQDRDYVEGLAQELNPALLAIEGAAEPENIPILDRESGRVLQVLAGDRRRIVEVGTAIGYSTLWMALGQGPDVRIVTIDPDRTRTDRARAFWRQAGVPDERITVVNRPALEAIGSDPALEESFDLLFLDALKAEYRSYLEALLPRLAPRALVVADNVLWSGKTSGASPAAADDESTNALRAFNQWLLGDPRFDSTILPVGDGLLVARLRP
jgi:predicted O-methyltransferase YrrM